MPVYNTNLNNQNKNTPSSTSVRRPSTLGNAGEVHRWLARRPITCGLRNGNACLGEGYAHQQRATAGDGEQTCLVAWVCLSPVKSQLGWGEGNARRREGRNMLVGFNVADDWTTGDVQSLWWPSDAPQPWKGMGKGGCNAPQNANDMIYGKLQWKT